MWHWSTSTAEAIADDSENRSSPFFESCQGIVAIVDH